MAQVPRRSTPRIAGNKVMPAARWYLRHQKMMASASKAKEKKHSKNPLPRRINVACARRCSCTLLATRFPSSGYYHYTACHRNRTRGVRADTTASARSHSPCMCTRLAQSTGTGAVGPKTPYHPRNTPLPTVTTQTGNHKALLSSSQPASQARGGWVVRRGAAQMWPLGSFCHNKQCTSCSCCCASA